nr:AMP-binding protein [Luteimonas sp.]
MSQPLVARLEATAAAFPERIALQQAQRRLDYTGLRASALRLAHALHARGVEPGDRVALILPNGIEAAVAWYGAWRAGAVVVPLNAQARERDFVPWLRHSGARLLVHGAGHDDAARAAMEAGVPAWVVAGDGDPASAFAAAPNAVAAAAELPMPDADALAAILYTSGTTGAPKGVALSHRNLAANTASILDYLRLGADDSIVSALPFYYTYGASVLHTHLAVGARVVLEDNVVFPHLIAEALARER